MAVAKASRMNDQLWTASCSVPLIPFQTFYHHSDGRTARIKTCADDHHSSIEHQEHDASIGLVCRSGSAEPADPCVDCQHLPTPRFEKSRRAARGFWCAQTGVKPLKDVRVSRCSRQRQS